jgi:four helix bundle protein
VVSGQLPGAFSVIMASKRVRSYRDLIAWQKAMDLVVSVYEVTSTWPKEELYGLTRQAREAVVGVLTNIAEGCGRNSPREFHHFLGISYGSLMELETEILVADRVGYQPPEDTQRILAATAEVGRLINGLKASLTTDYCLLLHV